MDVITLEQLLTKDIKGKVVCFPTDTVYGVGALIDDNEAINKIYHLKNRDISKPLAVLTGTKNIENRIFILSHIDTLDRMIERLEEKYREFNREAGKLNKDIFFKTVYSGY